MTISHRAAAAIAALLLSGALHAQLAAPEVTRLPLVIDGSQTEVTAHVYKPPGEGPFPLVIYSHGRSGERLARLKMESPMPAGHATWWIRRGVAVVAPVRVGYGATGGPDVENSGSLWRGGACYSQPDFETAGINARKTVVATY